MSQKVSVYIGSPIEYESERIVFQAVYDWLAAQDREAFMIANVNMGTTQVDLIIAFEKKTFVIEVKTAGSAIKGEINGTWHQRRSTDTWTPIRNYYEQTIKAGHAVKDELSSFLQRIVSYPLRLLLFSYLHPDSQIPASDFKVTITRLADWQGIDATASVDGCTLSEWRNFLVAKKIQLLTVPAAAISKELFNFEELLANYHRSVDQTYGADLINFVPVKAVWKNQNISSDEISGVLSENNNLLIAGSSGCSKTLLAKKIVKDLATIREVAIYLEAKYFELFLKPLLEDEIKLLGTTSALDLFTACRKLGQRITLIIDGHNECSVEKQKRIDRCLLAVCNRYDAIVVLVSQEKTAGNKALKLQLVEIPAPDLEMKRRIATKYSLLSSIQVLEPLLKTANSGMEAMIIGSMGVFPVDTLSKFSLFDFYVRKKLGPDSFEGVRALTAVAEYLSQRISFVLSIRELEHVLMRQRINVLIIEMLVNSKLLTRYFDKFSFSHELFFHAYTAASIIDATGQDKERLLIAMRTPVNKECRVFVIGAVDKEEILPELLENVRDYELLIALCLGEGGIWVSLFLHDRIRNLLFRMNEEAKGIRFTFVKDHFRSVDIDPTTQVQWDSFDMLLIHVLPDLLLRDQYTNEIFTIAANADKLIEKEFARLLPEAKERKVAIRSDLFASVYCPFSGVGCGLSKIVSDIHSGLVSLRSHNQCVPNLVESYLSIDNWSNGRLYLALNLSRFNECATPLFEIILHCYRDKWRYLPYHLKLQLHDSVHHFSNNEEQRLKLIEAVNNTLDNENPMINTFAVEALSSLGAFENEQQEQEDSIRSQIERILQDKEKPDHWAVAVGIFNSQFDHPYSPAYWHAVQRLGHDQKREFLIMVVRGSDDGFFTSTAILALAQTNDPDICRHLEKWRTQPNVDKSTMPQDELFNYILVHSLMGHFNYAIDSRIGTFLSVKDNALSAIAEIYYWVNQRGLDKMEIESKCETAWNYLANEGSDFAMDMVYQGMIALRNHDVGLGLKSPLKDLYEVFTDRVAAICRNAVQQPNNQKVVYKWDKTHEVLGRALSMLSTFGSLLDIPLLKSMATNEMHGSTAIQSIKTLQEKSLV
jgi:hypothetical protein